MDSVELKLEAGEIHVRLGRHDMMNWPCPECGVAGKQYDHQPERQWRHLDTCQYQTILHAEPPRSDCGDHGVRVVRGIVRFPFTMLFDEYQSKDDLPRRYAEADSVELARKNWNRLQRKSRKTEAAGGPSYSSTRADSPETRQ